MDYFIRTNSKSHSFVLNLLNLIKNEEVTQSVDSYESVDWLDNTTLSQIFKKKILHS